MADQGGSGATPAGWYPDPQGRYEQRYFDGTAWTEHVSTGGSATTDAGPGAAPTGASLYGSPASPYASAYGAAPMAAGHWSASPSPLATRPRRIERNTIGAGLYTAVGGFLLVAVATVLPWFGGRTLFDLPAATSYSASGGYTDNSPFLVAQVVGTMIWLILAIVCTTLPLQPGKVLGFFFGGCIGLIVCWKKVSPHDRTMRANILGVVLIAFALLRLWLSVSAVSDFISPTFQDMGAGPYVATLGYIVVAVGMLLGRSRKLVDI